MRNFAMKYIIILTIIAMTDINGNLQNFQQINMLIFGSRKYPINI